MTMATDPENEVPWFTSITEAMIKRYGCEDGDKIYGHLHFYGPDGKRAIIHLTLGETYQLETVGGGYGSPVWHIDLPGEDGIATVSPSVHFIGHWHSPNPVKFKIVESI